MYVFLFSFIILTSSLCIQVSASPHSHKHGAEREIDGAYSPRDHSHYEGEDHNVEFDHEAILGSTKEAEEFDHLPPEEAKKRLAVLLTKMDTNSDKEITTTELKQWILRSFKSLSEEESREKMMEVDLDKDNQVTWNEYKAETYGVDDEVEDGLFSGKEHAEEKALMKNDKELFQTADVNKDGTLSAEEFLAFTHPEEAPHMLEVILRQTLEEKDVNKDGFIDFQEYIGDRDSDVEVAKQKEMFDTEFDTNGDGSLDSIEFKRWVAPSNEEIAAEEVDHLFASADDDHDGLLSFEEILEHHDVFVGSEATDYGDHLNNIHRFQDEL
ncbi:reticulocalbin-2-like isoform X2 [Daphnia pulex]|uniref:reticulocalbin-2-like isoform X2 n=1 Tax=Daphnia pulex TaxID=6669 RepID=UPI001EDC9439|nr:reticulocalbin-2-like isoform X2 [Daphnia pulex]XP_046648042.1 reticulocalbin-2-like isoform X2 [Daphnia pulicaria]